MTIHRTHLNTAKETKANTGCFLQWEHEMGVNNLDTIMSAAARVDILA